MRGFFGIGIVLAMLALPARAGPCVDVALVLAIDGSGSISDEDYAFQTQAFATALLEPDVIAALDSAGRVAVAALVWGDAEFPFSRTGWHVIEQGRGVVDLARDLMSHQRDTAGNTDIGAGLWTALDMLQEVCAGNRIVNVSGDGKATVSPRRRPLPTLTMARNRAVGMGVSVNGLAITDEVPDLQDYYARNVIAGPQSFVIAVEKPEDFSDAIRRKLKREIERPAVTMLQVR